MANPVRNFDSLSYANELKEVGVPEKQANLQAKALFRVVDEQLLNKQDLREVESKLSSDIRDVKGDIKDVRGEIEKVEAKLSGEIKEIRRDVKESELRLFVRLIGAFTLIMGIFKFLPIHF